MQETDLVRESTLSLVAFTTSTHHQCDAVLGQDAVRLHQPVSFDTR